MTLLDLATKREDVRGRRFEGADVDLPGRVWPAKAALAEVTLVNPNFNNAELPEVVLSGAELMGSADLRDAKLRGARLDRARIENGNLTAAQLQDAVLQDAQLVANFDSADLSRVRGRNATFNGSSLYKVCLDDASLPGAAFRLVEMREAHADRADLTGTDFSGAKLFKFRATGADLGGADFTKADLREAVLDGAKVKENTEFSDADLRGASFRDVQLGRARLDGAEIDFVTYQLSCWNPDTVAHLVVDKKVRRPVDLDKFPPDVQRLVDAKGPVLVLTFDEPVAGWHAHVFASFVFAHLGEDTPPVNVEPATLAAGPSLWVTGLDSENLEKLALAFERLEWRTWPGDSAAPPRKTVIRMADPIDELRKRCVGIKLRGQPTTTGEIASRQWTRADLLAAKDKANPAREPWTREHKISAWGTIGAMAAAVIALIALLIGLKCDSNQPSSAGSTSTSPATPPPRSDESGADDRGSGA